MRVTVVALAGLAAIVALALALVTPTIAAASTSTATSGEALQLSADGTRFSTALSSGLFDLSDGLVPATEETGHFWVRNATPHRAYLRLALARADVSDRTLATALSLSTVVDGISGIRTSLDSAADCTVLGRATVVEAGGTAAVDVVLSLGDLAGSVAQRTTAAFSLAVSLSDAPEATALAACTPSAVRVPVTSPGPGAAAEDEPTVESNPTAGPPWAVDSPEFISSAPLGGDWATLWPIAGLVLGGIAFAGVARRRKPRPTKSSREEVAP